MAWHCSHKQYLFLRGLSRMREQRRKHHNIQAFTPSPSPGKIALQEHKSFDFVFCISAPPSAKKSWCLKFPDSLMMTRPPVVAKKTKCTTCWLIRLIPGRLKNTQGKRIKLHTGKLLTKHLCLFLFLCFTLFD